MLSRLQRSDGFTMIELMVALAVAGILFAIAAPSLHAYLVTQQESSTAQSLLGTFRMAEERAQAEGRTYCVSVDSSTSWSLWRYSCNPADDTPAPAKQVDTYTASGNATVSNATFPTSFSTTSGSTLTCGNISCAFFDPRGVASKGSVEVNRPNSNAVYTVNVEGLTGRVYLTR